MLSKNKQSPARAKAKTEYILTTKLFCGNENCKEMMIGISGTSWTKKVYNYYSCNGIRKKICNKKNVSKEYIEDIVVNEVRNLLTDKRIKEISSEFVRYIDKQNNDTELHRLNKLIEENKKQKENLLNSLAICDIESVKKDIFKKIEQIQSNMEELEKQIEYENSQRIDVTAPEIEFFLTEMRNGDINDIRYRKLLVNTLINKIYLYDDNMTFIFNIRKEQKNIKLPTIEEIESSFLDKDGQLHQRGLEELKL